MLVGAFHIRKADYFVLLSDMGILTHFTPPILFGLANHDPVP